MMNKFPELFPGVRVGPQPTDEDISELKRLGIKSVIDFREPSETQTPNSVLARRNHLPYTNVPVSRDYPSLGAVEQLEQVMRDQSGPYLLHCGSGIRAVTVYLLREAKHQGWSAEHVEQEAKRHGFDLSSAPALQRLVHDVQR